MENLKQQALKKLKERNVKISDLTPIVYDLQAPFNPKLTYKECQKTILSILDKREVQHAILTGILLDETIETNQKESTIHKLIFEDNSLYGIDETIALSITNLYGSIALTTFGFLDKSKPGIIGIIDQLGKQPNTCNTHLDDLLCAIAAAAASKIAHSKKAT